MGGTTSKPSITDIEKTSDKARLSRELSDKILTLFFRNADFKDLLSLSSISACPRYVFTTADALTTLFQKIKVYPALGAKGEVLYSPIDRVSPGIFKDKKNSSQGSLERTKFRNQMCMDVAYFYVRTFQIYAALALTVIDTDPVRRRLRQPTAYGNPKPGVYQSGLFVGGAKLAPGRGIGREISASPFAPLIPFFEEVSGSTGIKYIKLVDTTGRKNTGEFIIEWKPQPFGSQQSKMTLKAIYKRLNGRVEEEVSMYSPEQNRMILLIGGRPIQEFYYNVTSWSLLYNDNESSDPTEFINKIHEFFTSSEYNRSSSARPRASATSSSGLSGLSGSFASSAQGKSSFDGFDVVKKLYDARYEGKDFPKAYCVARAMTLMNPIYEGERADQRQLFYTDVCKSTLDFELAGDLMPRPGRQPKANVYFKSLVGLYYDEYVLKGDEVIFTKSPASAEALKQGSMLLARLHNITATPETFIESGTEFKGSSLCKTKDASLIYSDPGLRTAMLKEVINPMLAFQEQHNLAVNNFLAKMFVLSADPKVGQQDMKFSAALKDGGRESVNNFGRAAAALLLDYYLRSEALYSKGVILLERNPNGLRAV